MRTISKRSKIAIAIASGALVVATGGAAFAYWTSGGHGTGTASAGTNSPITVNQTGSVGGLLPGGPADALSGDFTNNNYNKVYVTQVSVAVDPLFSSQADSSKPACTPADFTLVQPTATNAEIPGGSHVGSWSGASIAMTDSGTNQDNCKGAQLLLVYTSN